MKICKTPQIELFPFELSSKINNRQTYNTSAQCKVMQSGHQNVRQLIIFRHTCTPAILFRAYSYARVANFWFRNSGTTTGKGLCRFLVTTEEPNTKRPRAEAATGAAPP